jgi:hypothetical protein
MLTAQQDPRRLSEQLRSVVSSREDLRELS